VIPITETDNPKTSEIDRVSTLDAIRLINNEDKLVADAIEKVLPEIALAIDEIVVRLQNGGRLFYMGPARADDWACSTHRKYHRRSACLTT
jgi:N-acetylmuramic acid 6-phosphate etherase